RGRQGDRPTRARAPADAPPGALGAADPRRRRRAGSARDGADAARRGRPPRHRMRRADSPRLVAYAGLAAIGLVAGLAAGRVELTLGCARWGAFRVGPALVRAHDALGFHTWEADVGVVQPLRVYPSVETMRALLEPFETQAYVGNQVARTRGDGIEFADIREW